MNRIMFDFERVRDVRKFENSRKNHSYEHILAIFKRHGNREFLMLLITF